MSCYIVTMTIRQEEKALFETLFSSFDDLTESFRG
jgi:hypothetical protein